MRHTRINFWPHLMSKERLCIYVLLGAFLILLCTQHAFGQPQVQHRAPTALEEGSTAELVFEVPGISADNVQDAFLYYRIDGSIAYEQKKLELRHSTLSTFLDIPAGSAGSLEYYMQIHYIDGSRQTYPVNGEAGNPIRVEIIESRQADQPGSGTEAGIEYTILSPEQGEEIVPEDVVIAVTLFYDEEAIDTTTTTFRMLLDGEDITDQATASPYFFTYVPDELPAGEHSVALKVETEDGTEEVVAWSFLVTDEAIPMALDESDEIAAASGRPSGQVEVTAKNQIIAGNSRDVLSGYFSLQGQKNDIRYSAYGLLTSQEDSRLQPQNRYGAELYVGDWFGLQAGHVYPVLNPLTVAGQRVQGINIGLHAFNRSLNAQFIYGKLRRQISNIYDAIEIQPQSFEDVTVDTSYVLSIRDEGLGTYRRDIIGGRVSLERDRRFSLGLNVLKVQDDTNSVDLISDYRDLIDMRPDIARNLSLEDRNKLEAEPGRLNVNGNPMPKDNFVAASDLALNLHGQRIRFRADGAMSLLNEDISGGIFSSERARDLGFEMDDGVENMLEKLSWLIIINENITPLPLRFTVDGETSDAQPFFPTSALATQSELSFNYYKNNLKLQYRWVGPDFGSLANTTVRKDIAGYTISDRFRLFGNRIYMTLGYEKLQDNVIDHKDATTHTESLRGNISWYPISQKLPRVSVGLLSRNRENGIDLYNPYVASSLEKAAIKNYETRNGDTVVAPSARLLNTFQFNTSVSQQFQLLGLTHGASLNYSLLKTRDDSYAYGATNSNSLSLYITNRYQNLPLDTRLGFSFNSTQAGGGLTDISILGFNMGGSAFLLDDRLNIDATLAFTQNRTEIMPLAVNNNDTPNNPADDYYKPDTLARSYNKNHSYVFRTEARYDIDESHAFQLTARFANVISMLDGMQIPNDHLLQARYIFSF